jgi:hypothetical protein
VKIARLFDGKDAEGNWTFAPDRPRITDPAELARVVGFLRGGTMIVRISGLDVDRVDPAKGDAVPLSTMTDGEWIWGEGLRYYVETYGIAPEQEFLDHMAAYEFVTPLPEESARRAALEQLRAR